HTRSTRDWSSDVCSSDLMRAVRGAEISLIFQEPMTALNPVFTIGDQIAEALLVHDRATRADARAMAIDLLDAVRIPEAASRVRRSEERRVGKGCGSRGLA